MLFPPPLKKKKAKETLLRLHNDARRRVASGSAVGAWGARLPEGHVPDLRWDDGLSAGAQSWANRCRDGHDDGAARAVASGRDPEDGGGVGQNAAWQAASAYGPELNYQRMFQQWFDEVRVEML